MHAGRQTPNAQVTEVSDSKLTLENQLSFESFPLLFRVLDDRKGDLRHA